MSAPWKSAASQLLCTQISTPWVLLKAGLERNFEEHIEFYIKCAQRSKDIAILCIWRAQNNEKICFDVSLEECIRDNYF